MTVLRPQPRQSLTQLATLHGVQSTYVDTAGQRRPASVTSLLAVLGMLGAPIAALSDAPSALRARREELWQRVVEPVVTLWSRHRHAMTIRLPAAQLNGQLSCHLQPESGELIRWEAALSQLPVQDEAEVEGVSYRSLTLWLPQDLPEGYYGLKLELSGREFQALVIKSPQRAYAPARAGDRREWGVFAPLYALHSEQSWGCGDFSDLESLSMWLAERGGQIVTTLPLLAAFLDEPYEPSPYAPASRLFWNELYIDVTRAPGWKTCEEARARWSAPGFQDALAVCRSSYRVGYRQAMGLKRSILECLATSFFATSANRDADFQAYLNAHPAAEDYARFRAVGDRLRTPWRQWPEVMRQGTIAPGDYDEPTWRYHLYAQWVAHVQLTRLAEVTGKADVKLYLDLPLGVHADSYDVWRERNTFVLDASGGAPPDSFFTKGQNWGSPPLHPDVIRRQGYRYVRDYLRHQLQPTGLLRIDHVMGLHRLFWVPRGAEPSQGVYVRYAAEELYAILNLESHRHHVTLVGENLGTVPQYVNTAMKRHRMHQMYVAQYELTSEPASALPEVPRVAVASLNTHDMPPFAAYCQGLDIDDRRQQGLIEPEQATRERHQREVQLNTLQDFLTQRGWLGTSNPDLRPLFTACLAYLSASAAEVVLFNLEDLWLETQPQNFPGTHGERPNWQSKVRYRLDQVYQDPEVLATLDLVCLHRRQRSLET